jgi:hypothetical protein
MCFRIAIVYLFHCFERLIEESVLSQTLKKFAATGQGAPTHSKLYYQGSYRLFKLVTSFSYFKQFSFTSTAENFISSFQMK